MARSVSAGYPIFLGGGFYPMALWRQYDGGTAVNDLGTAAAVSPAGGVFGNGMAVSAPVSGLTVTVAAGFCSVPAPSGQGAYRFGLMQSASLTVPSNGTGSTRKDLVLANVQDLGNSSSFAQVEYVTGTTSPPLIPPASIVLAEVDVTNGASNITSGMITDKRTWVVAPGGILPVANKAAAPLVPSGQLMYDLAAGQLLAVAVTHVTEVLTGSGTWTCPQFVQGSTVRAQCWGGGAGGTSVAGSGGGGGAGGAYSEEPALAVSAGVGYAYTAGAAGVAGVQSGPAATPGGTTTMHGAVTTVTAGGGQILAGNATGGTAGAASGNTISFAGGAGGDGIHLMGGGGGAAAGTTGAGANGTTALLTSPGPGGAAAGGGGAGGTGGNGARGGTGQPGGAPGGGGGGGTGGGAGTAAGAGAAGRIILTYVIAPGPQPVSRTGPSTRYAFTSSGGTLTSGTGTQTILSLSMTADGSSDYEIAAFTGNLVAGSGKSGNAKLAILVDGAQADAISLNVPTSGGDINCGWTYFTSGAQGTTMTAGNHVVTFALIPSGGSMSVTGPAYLRVAAAPGTGGRSGVTALG